MNISSFGARTIALATAALVCSLPLVSQAGTTTGNLAVSATIAANCTFGTSTLAFGNYDPVVANLTTALQVTGTVNLSCTKNDAITLAADTGLNHANATGTCSGSACTRAMKSGTNYLSYDIYTTNAYSTVWSATNTIAATGTGASQAVNVYGYIPAGSNQPTGSYGDTVVVTATF